MTTLNETGRIAARPRRMQGWLAGLSVGLLLIGGCDEEDNTWKSAVPGDSPDVSLALAIDLRGGGAAHERQPLDYVLTARNGSLICGNSNGFNWHIILPVHLVPLDRADEIQNYEGKYEKPDQAAQHNANPLENLADHIVHLTTKW